MEEYNQTCKFCGREFLVRVTTDRVPGGKMKEEVTCPYCHEDNGHRMTSGRVQTYKLED